MPDFYDNGEIPESRDELAKARPVQGVVVKRVGELDEQGSEAPRLAKRPHRFPEGPFRLDRGIPRRSVRLVREPPPELGGEEEIRKRRGPLDPRRGRLRPGYAVERRIDLDAV